MKHILIATIGAVTFVAASPLVGQSNVTTRYANWEHRLRDRVNDLLYYPQAANGATGDVFVGFRIGTDGLPTDIAVQQTSGVQDLDQTAVKLVSRLGRIGPVPSANGDVRDIVIKLSYREGASAIASMRLAQSDRIEQAANEKRDRALIPAPARTVALDGSGQAGPSSKQEQPRR